MNVNSFNFPVVIRLYMLFETRQEGVLLRTYLGIDKCCFGVHASDYGDEVFTVKGNIEYNREKVGIHWYLEKCDDGKHIRLQNETGFFLCMLTNGSVVLMDNVNSADDNVSFQFLLEEIPNAPKDSKFKDFAGTYLGGQLDICFYVHKGNFK